jgi:cytochrome oxidase assembly protein ShyY1
MNAHVITFIIQIVGILTFGIAIMYVCLGSFQVSEKRWNAARQARWQRELALEAKRREREAEYMNHT